jgi:cobyrinic acid a,c-diamide synthase
MLEARPQGHGYVTAEVTGGNPFFPAGTTLRGHEFHHSRIVPRGELKFAYSISRGRGVDGRQDGIVRDNVLASYLHLHAKGTAAWAGNLVRLAVHHNSKRKLIIQAGG